ncbi:MAG TPA: DUF177 domain-containing protein [Dehalococcoidia bacterium]|nr:DUF177 domain-containing protein [Dehalococcoidia bacterium]
MRFNVATLLQEPTGSVRRYPLEPGAQVHAGSVRLVRTPGGVLVEGTFEALNDAVCSRCLAPFSSRTPVEFEEVFHQQFDLATGRRMPGPDDSDAFLISTRNIIDITEAVRQYSEVAAALQPLCNVDCPGLCPVCGVDLNLSRCDCDREPADPRWAALAALKRPQG